MPRQISDHGILRRSAPGGLTSLVAPLLIGWVAACGGSVKNNGDPAEVSSGGAGGLGTGGAMGTGGALGDSGVTVACSDDGGLSPPALARQCTQDSDCSIQIAPRCCGANGALGVAKSEASVYSGCFAMSPSARSGLGCATYFGYVTDTGRTTPWSQSVTQPIDLVSYGAQVTCAPPMSCRRMAGRMPPMLPMRRWTLANSPAAAGHAIPVKLACYVRGGLLSCAKHPGMEAVHPG